MLSIRQCLERLESGKPCSMRVVKYDRKRNRGGEELEIPECVLVQPDQIKKDFETWGERAPTKTERLLAGYDFPDEDRRNPKHRIFYTRNVRLLFNGQPTTVIQKIHPPLIIEFDGETTTA